MEERGKGVQGRDRERRGEGEAEKFPMEDLASFHRL